MRIYLLRRSVEENVIVFDDNDVKSPEPLNEVPEQSVSEAGKLSQVQADSGSDEVKVDTGMVNHQQITTDINSVESDHNKQSPFEIENDKQSLGEKSPDNVSDKKLIESSYEEDKSPVLGLRFTGVLSEQSEDKVNEKTDEDGDLLEDNLEYVNVLGSSVIHTWLAQGNAMTVLMCCHLVSY